MRDIKFRAFYEDKMYYADKFFSGLGCDYFQIFGEEWAFVNYEENYTMFDFNDGILMQYTGLKDKKGKDIYEGDIIRYDSDESMNKWVRGEIAEVIYIPARFLLRMSPFNEISSNVNIMRNDVEDCVEVIGNIYENPELLEETK